MIVYNVQYRHNVTIQHTETEVDEIVLDMKTIETYYDDTYCCGASTIHTDNSNGEDDSTAEEDDDDDNSTSNDNAEVKCVDNNDNNTDDNTDDDDDDDTTVSCHDDDDDRFEERYNANHPQQLYCNGTTVRKVRLFFSLIYVFAPYVYYRWRIMPCYFENSI